MATTQAGRTGKRRTVGVLMGGRSAERRVSLRTGAAILAALQRLGERAVAIDAGPDLPRALARRGVDVAFIALHGRGGEDGTVQGLLECLGVPYTGSGVLASALAMDKKQSKYVFRAHGLPTPDFEVFARGTRAARRLQRLAPPVVVKPTNEGSSVGMTVVRGSGALAPALAKAFRYDPEAIAEQFLPGREFTVGVLEGETFPVVEVRPHSGVYDYHSKYTAGETDYLAPAPIGARLAARLRALAAQTHGALGCRGASRVDFRLDGRGRPYVLEVNTIPGMTETSLLPKSAAAAGIGFDELVARILRGARLDGGRR
jgi:D-alanine-D-alanine ligase